MGRLFFQKGGFAEGSQHIPDLISGTQTEDAADCHRNVERYQSMRVRRREFIFEYIDDYAMNAQKIGCVVHGIFYEQIKGRKEEEKNDGEQREKVWNDNHAVLTLSCLCMQFTDSICGRWKKQNMYQRCMRHSGRWFHRLWQLCLALITKEVYSSLFVGIVIGGIFWSRISVLRRQSLHVFQDGIVGVLTDSYNVGILVFLVVLGIMVCMMNKAGGSAAFGRWASTHIKTRVGAQLATIVLGILIFIDDYFNCLTVGSVMRPVTDKHNVSTCKTGVSD